MKVWGFTWDETLIDDDADDQRIRDVLDLIGRGDEFEKLRERAYSEVEQPTPPVSAESAKDFQRDFDEVARQLRKLRGPRKPDLTKFKGFT